MRKYAVAWSEISRPMNLSDVKKKPFRTVQYREAESEKEIQRV